MATMAPGRRDLLIVLALGAAGAAAVLLATRQGWGRVTIDEPRPLPSSVTRLTGQALVPAASPLAVATLAGLAAVLATRGLLRCITGILLAVFGSVIAAAASISISAADMTAAAGTSAGPATGAAAGTAAGSTTTGSSPGGPAAPVAGFHAHAALTALPWRPAMIAGALLIVAAGVMTTWRAGRLPGMSSRYDAPAAVPAGPEREPAAARTGQAPPRRLRGRVGGAQLPDADAASLWESLSRGEDPTGPPAAVPRD